MKVRFLIIRFSSIGDIVLTSPVVRMLHNQVEGAEIHYLTKKQFLPVLKGNPYIHKIHLFNGKNMPGLIDELKFLHFDYIIDLHHNLRSLKIKNRLSVMAFSFKKLNIEKYLLVHFKINRLPDVHIVDRYLETVKVFDIQNDNKGLDYFIPVEDEFQLNRLPVSFHEGYIAFAIGGGHHTKKLPFEKLVSLCTKTDQALVLLGGPEDKETGGRIVDEVLSTRPSNKIVSLCGVCSLNESASLVKQARLVISHDTGLMHIAASFQKKILSIWGNTIPEFGMHPYLADPASFISEVNNLKCRPCSKIGFSSCPKKHFNCMQNQDEHKILSWLQNNF